MTGTPDYQAMHDALPAALEPPYQTAQDGRSIWLYRGPGQWRSDTARTDVDDAFIYLDLLPTPHLYIAAKVPATIALADWISDKHGFELPRQHRPPDAPMAELEELGKQEGTVQQLGPNTGVNVGSRRMTKYVDFVVLNYPELTGHRIRYPIGSNSARVQFAAGGWAVTLDAVAGSGDVWKRLQRDGGVAVTHAGRLERLGGGSSRRRWHWRSLSVCTTSSGLRKEEAARRVCR
jgi:hypothetical protein